MTLQVQFTTITYMLLGGIYLGIALETFRRFSPLWKHNKFLVYCLEICFWLLQTLILFYVLYLANSGELRFYVFIACLLGFSMYQALFASAYKKILEYMIRFSLKFYHFCRRVVQLTIFTPIKWIFTLIVFVGNSILTLVFSIVKVLFLPIKWLSKLIYFLLPEKLKKKVNKTPQFYSIIKNTCKKWMRFFKRR